MKNKQLFYWVGIIAISVIIVFFVPQPSKVSKNLLRDYQLDLVDEHRINVYDGERFVGWLPLDIDTSNPTDLDKLIYIDNQ